MKNKKNDSKDELSELMSLKSNTNSNGNSHLNSQQIKINGDNLSNQFSKSTDGNCNLNEEKIINSVKNNNSVTKIDKLSDCDKKLMRNESNSVNLKTPKRSNQI